VVGAQVAVLTNAVCVIRSVNVGTLVCWFLSASCVVAILAHSFRIKLQVCVWTGRHNFFVLRLLGLE
jgi:hypothetical protein